MLKGYECVCDSRTLHQKHGFFSGRKTSGLDTRAGFAVYSSFQSKEYLAAQRMRLDNSHTHI